MTPNNLERVKSSINHSNVRARLEYDLSTQVSYHNKDTLNKQDRLLDKFNFHMCNKKNLEESNILILEGDVNVKFPIVYMRQLIGPYAAGL